jgi:hypothetical protein
VEARAQLLALLLGQRAKGGKQALQPALEARRLAGVAGGGDHAHVEAGAQQGDDFADHGVVALLGLIG